MLHFLPALSCGWYHFFKDTNVHIAQESVKHGFTWCGVKLTSLIYQHLGTIRPWCERQIFQSLHITGMFGVVWWECECGISVSMENHYLRLCCLRSLLSLRRSLLLLSLLLLFLSWLRLRDGVLRRWWRFSLSRSGGYVRGLEGYTALGRTGLLDFCSNRCWICLLAGQEHHEIRWGQRPF